VATTQEAHALSVPLAGVLSEAVRQAAPEALAAREDTDFPTGRNLRPPGRKWSKEHYAAGDGMLRCTSRRTSVPHWFYYDCHGWIIEVINRQLTVGAHHAA
jgi:hypothetical protein